MCNTKAEEINLQNRTDYKIGAVTYQVIAFFDETKPPLKEKIQRLLVEDVTTQLNRIFADSQKAL